MHAGFAESLQVYLQQPCAQPAISLALLYCTVLSFGLLSTAYLKHLGLSEALVSVARGAGAVSGLLATVAYPRLRGCLGALCLCGECVVGCVWVLMFLVVVLMFVAVFLRVFLSVVSLVSLCHVQYDAIPRVCNMAVVDVVAHCC